MQRQYRLPDCLRATSGLLWRTASLLVQLLLQALLALGYRPVPLRGEGKVVDTAIQRTAASGATATRSPPEVCGSVSSFWRQDGSPSGSRTWSP